MPRGEFCGCDGYFDHPAVGQCDAHRDQQGEDWNDLWDGYQGSDLDDYENSRAVGRKYETKSVRFPAEGIVASPMAASVVVLAGILAVIALRDLLSPGIRCRMSTEVGVGVDAHRLSHTLVAAEPTGLLRGFVRHRFGCRRQHHP